MVNETFPVPNNETGYELMAKNLHVSEISPDGLGFGHGKISGADDMEVLSQVKTAIYHSPNILVAVDKDESGGFIDDDGCGDGRAVCKVFNQDTEFKRSLNRSKVFGGAVTMAVASRIGLGLAREKPLLEVFDDSIENLLAAGLDFGAHTDSHAAGKNCGCGAIDRAHEAIAAANVYKGHITEVIAALGVETSGIDEVFANFGRYVSEAIPYDKSYSGSQAKDKIKASANKPVLKELSGEHRERRIVLNHAAGFTVNQALVRQATDEKAQVFAVDVWRLNDIAMGLYAGQPEIQRKALLSELVYTLSIAAVLTKGDLPVDKIEAEADWGTTQQTA